MTVKMKKAIVALGLAVHFGACASSQIGDIRVKPFQTVEITEIRENRASCTTTGTVYRGRYYVHAGDNGCATDWDFRERDVETLRASEVLIWENDREFQFVLFE